MRERERRASTFRFGGGTSFDPVRSTRVLQVHRSLGPDHSLNTPRCTCRGIIHCLYFPLLPPPLFLSPVALIYRPWRFFPRPSRVSISFLLLSRLRFFLSPSTSPFTLCSRGTLLGDAPCSKRLLSFGSPPAPCSFISYYRNPPVYPFSHPRPGLAFGAASLRRIAYYMLFLGAGRRFLSRTVESTARERIR